jgi:hypothetical protein
MRTYLVLSASVIENKQKEVVLYAGNDLTVAQQLKANDSQPELFLQTWLNGVQILTVRKDTYQDLWLPFYDKLDEYVTMKKDLLNTFKSNGTNKEGNKQLESLTSKINNLRDAIYEASREERVALEMKARKDKNTVELYKYLRKD